MATKSQKIEYIKRAAGNKINEINQNRDKKIKENTEEYNLLYKNILSFTQKQVKKEYDLDITSISLSHDIWARQKQIRDSFSKAIENINKIKQELIDKVTFEGLDEDFINTVEKAFK